MARAKSLKLQVPPAGADKPHLGRVGTIAAAGFVLGIVWPWLAGVTLVPKPPRENVAPVAEAEPKPKPKAPPASKAKPAKPVKQASPKREKTSKRVKVGKATITSCRDAEGRKVSACDPIPIDERVVPKIEALEGCEAAESAEGTLSLGMKVDFASNKITRYLQGKSTTLATPVAKQLIGCAKQALAETNFNDVPHNHQDYTVFYVVELAAPSAAGSDDAAATSDEDVTPASGMATVAWVAARVRSGPTQDSPELARLASGARVKVVGKQGDWYKVRWDAKGSEGWVFKAAIGM